MVLSEAIEDYGQFIRHELGHAKTTYHAYVSWQRNFARWLTANGHPDPLVTEISPDLVRSHSYGMSSRDLRPRTVRGALHALRAPFAWLCEKEAITTNPAKEVRLPKKDAAQRLLVTDEDLAKLLVAAGRQPTDFRCVRDRAVLSVLIFCRLRRQEFLGLEVGSVNLTEPTSRCSRTRARSLGPSISATRPWRRYESGWRCVRASSAGTTTCSLERPRPTSAR